MPLTSRTASIALAAILGLAAAAAAQEGMPPLPKPGPEHAVLAADAGTWDAVVETWMAPGQPPMTSKAVEINTLINGMYLISDFKGDFGGMPFQGHGLTWWDAASKTYKGIWVDNTSPAPMNGSSTFDAASKTFKGEMTGTDMTGALQTMRSETVQKADGTRVMTMFMKGPDGKDTQTMKVTYTKRP
jgi:hypothetical protein